MRASALALAALFLAGSPFFAGDGAVEARRTAERFGTALTSGQASGLRGVLPSVGKIYLALHRIADEEGSFGAGQVEAIFRDALVSVKVRSFEIVGVESDGSSSALVHARATLTDREGRAGHIALHLSFQREDGAFVVREIRERIE